MKWTDDQEREVVAAYESGETLRAVAKRFSVSTQPVTRILQQHGVERRRGGRRGKGSGVVKRDRKRGPSAITTDERAEIKRRWLAGETQIALGRHFDIGATTIAHVLRQEGIPAGIQGQVREHHHRWKGGRTFNGEGYAMLRVLDDDALAQAMCPRKTYVLEHRLVMARHLGRPLRANESIHHINGNKLDNRIENLQLRNGQHGKGKTLRCRCCGSTDIEEVPLDG